MVTDLVDKADVAGAVGARMQQLQHAHLQELEQQQKPLCGGAEGTSQALLQTFAIAGGLLGRAQAGWDVAEGGKGCIGSARSTSNAGQASTVVNLMQKHSEKGKVAALNVSGASERNLEKSLQPHLARQKGKHLRERDGMTTGKL